VDNMALPIHRWFRYSAGFSAMWVRQLLLKERDCGRRFVLDPFAGSATVLLEAELVGLDGAGFESHPFVARIACAKLAWHTDTQAFTRHALSILRESRRRDAPATHPSELIRRCFSPDALSRLNALRATCEAQADGSPASELTWLALVSILRDCASVGTAQWQYVLPEKAKARVLDPYAAFEAKVHLMSQDMAYWQRSAGTTHAVLHRDDARTCHGVPDAWADLIVTSPPYANNYDYADATRLEMSFLQEIGGWGELQGTIRKHLVRSCTQHVAPLLAQTYQFLEDPLLTPIRAELLTVCKQLEEERLLHGGKKPYHTMIVLYFLDLANVWRALRRVARDGCLTCFVIGDSAPYGIYVPVDRWLGELALAAGFKSYTFEKTRDRNIKWKNRKHRVPLHEGRLWVCG
jgi:hypothetical protein